METKTKWVLCVMAFLVMIVSIIAAGIRWGVLGAISALASVAATFIYAVVGWSLYDDLFETHNCVMNVNFGDKDDEDDDEEENDDDESEDDA